MTPLSSKEIIAVGGMEPEISPYELQGEELYKLIATQGLAISLHDTQRNSFGDPITLLEESLGAEFLAKVTISITGDPDSLDGSLVATFRQRHNDLSELV